MIFTRDQLSAGLLSELDRFEELLRSLPSEDRDTPTRCTGWSVGDVSAHMIGTMADIAAGRLEGLGTPEVTEREVAERRSSSLKELADECAEVRKATEALLPAFPEESWSQPAPGGYDGTLADAVEALWYDAFLHADDIRAAVGRPSELGPGLAPAISHVTTELGKLGCTPTAPSADETGMAYVLVATGRAPESAYPEPLVNIYAD
ncbi:MAG: maleylpyruvate isomerase family mycothiol-dependent enzyme [Frankiaceae bacterium]|nr:maleylpyruvate isomerase family mycothiol-dependent enzyme [Frankiaceae bacterium]MBV9872829.1 maleylpyruvate isomerase family mycothiol-dependent enzyme [Frankiaceae bacterium]